jgi:hypothetical protein
VIFACVVSASRRVVMSAEKRSSPLNSQLITPISGNSRDVSTTPDKMFRQSRKSRLWVYAQSPMTSPFSGHFADTSVIEGFIPWGSYPNRVRPWNADATLRRGTIPLCWSLGLFGPVRRIAAQTSSGGPPFCASLPGQHLAEQRARDLRSSSAARSYKTRDPAVPRSAPLVIAKRGHHV